MVVSSPIADKATLLVHRVEANLVSIVSAILVDDRHIWPTAIKDGKAINHHTRFKIVTIVRQAQSSTLVNKQHESLHVPIIIQIDAQGLPLKRQVFEAVDGVKVINAGVRTTAGE